MWPFDASKIKPGTMFQVLDQVMIDKVEYDTRRNYNAPKSYVSLKKDDMLLVLLDEGPDSVKILLPDGERTIAISRNGLNQIAKKAF